MPPSDPKSPLANRATKKWSLGQIPLMRREDPGLEGLVLACPGPGPCGLCMEGPLPLELIRADGPPAGCPQGVAGASRVNPQPLD